MNRYLPAILITLLLILPLSGRENSKYIITVKNVETFSAPDRTSPRIQSGLQFGTVVIPERTVFNDYDFNYLEIIHAGKKIYLPQEMCILLDSDADDTILRYESQKSYPSHYIPDELEIINKSCSLDAAEVHVRHEMLDDLYRFIEKGRMAGYSLKVAGGYASLDDRIAEYEKAIKEDPKQSYVKPPLESDYGSGFAVDFSDTLVGPNYKKYFMTYKLWQWLSDNAAEFNFVPTEFPYKFIYSASSVADKGDILWKYRIVQIVDWYRLRLFRGKPSPHYSFLWIHNNETTAGRTLSYAHERYGANSVTLINGGKRYIQVNYNKRNYMVDPNRIFTDKGLDRHLKKLYRTSTSPYALEIKKQMRVFRKELIEQLDWSEQKYLIALHSSLKDSDFSVDDFTNSRKYLLYRNQDQNPKNFIFVTLEQDFKALSKLGYNTVYQKSIDDDGSLSIYAHYRKFPYINIEVVEGDEYSQKKMLDAVIAHIIKRKAQEAENEK